MADLGHDLLFGANLTPSARDHGTLVELAVTAEEVGLEMVGFQDHPYQPSFLDTTYLQYALLRFSEWPRIWATWSPNPSQTFSTPC